MVSTALGASIFFILLLALLVLTTITLFYYDQVQKRNKDTTKSINPFCFRQICASSGTAPDTLNVNQDPQKYNNQVVNYCLTNAIDCGLQGTLGLCASGDTSQVTAAQVTSLADFYNNQYYPRCQYGLGSNQTTPATASGNATVNSTNLVSGPNSDALVNLVQCAKKLNLSSNPNVQALNTICGTLCPGV
ncbi:MAG: hypothetical protein Solivirus4_3 [Solivirus sp.]|uniref:Uncharacterized protein n=1 Tax=Solivirus sp. TaxID=2487772 RepID=A0A3G5AFT9_9VIRU|nr:MAG: hypothetical protein Solivirus4_3 [Solivirus sp.]